MTRASAPRRCLRRRRYHRRHHSPQSIPFVIYGVATGTSIGDLFKAGIIPGLADGSWP